MRSFLVLLLILSPLSASAKWITYEECTLDPDQHFDGDSFHVKAATGHTYVFRLYGVDCPETDARFPDRNKEQAKDFGVPEKDIIKWGKKATAFTKKFLRKPFTVHTEKQKARGAGSSIRYYAILINADGQRLDGALLEAGLARCYGVGAEWPKRMTRERFLKKLHPIESKAKREDVGIWND
jgi:endonuclease YncB( thermonuclease family)